MINEINFLQFVIFAIIYNSVHGVERFVARCCSNWRTSPDILQKRCIINHLLERRRSSTKEKEEEEEESDLFFCFVFVLLFFVVCLYKLLMYSYVTFSMFYLGFVGGNLGTVGGFSFPKLWRMPDFIRANSSADNSFL